MQFSPAMLLLTILGGVCLAAASGFRVFVPLLVAGAASRLGFLSLNNGLDWLASDIGLAVLGVACAVEIAGFYVPWVDHALDWIALPGAVVAGSLLATSQVTDLNPTATWLIGILSGGTTAGLVQGATMLTRGVSLVTTGGAGNPIVATGETLLSIIVTIVAIVVPVLALLVAGVGLYFIIRWHVTRKRKMAMSAMRVAT